MSDYLSNLVARSFDLAGDIEIVSPRLPSLFESSHETWSVFSGKPETFPVSDKTGDGEPSLARHRAAQEKARMEKTQELRRDERVTWSQGSEVDLLNLRPPEFLKTVEPLADGQPTAAPGSQKENIFLSVLHPAKLGNEKFNTKDTGSAPPEEHAARDFTLDDQSTQKGRTKERSVVVQERYSAQPVMQTDKERILIGNVIITNGPAKSNNVNGSSSSEDSKQYADISPLAAQQIRRVADSIPMSQQDIGDHKFCVRPEPTINVTIGRIEVRAAAPPAVQKKEIRRPRAMSLDDYLKQRSGSKK
jgi:hypothetical protein